MLCLASLALPVLLLAQTPPSEAQTTFAQSIYRQGFRLAATPLAIRQTRLAGTCAAVCSTYAGCVSVNYKVSTGECELLGAFLCQDEVTNLQPATDWAYYDMEPTQDAYVFAPLLMSDACQTSGICSTKCARALGEPCRATVQCFMGSIYPSYCTGGTCLCQEDLNDYFPTAWMINASTCHMPRAWYVPGSMRLYKKIWPSGTCTIGMKIKSASSLFSVRLITSSSISTSRYDVEISETDIVLKEVVNDVATIRSSGGFQGLSNIDYTLFKVDWCGGIISVGPNGAESLVSWTPTSLLPLTHILFDPQDNPASVTEILANHLVDQWYPSGNLTSPRDPLAQIVRAFPGGPVGDFELVFYCKGAADCKLTFYEDDMFAAGFSVCIGCDLDTHSVITIWNSYFEYNDMYVDSVSNRVDPSVWSPFWIQVKNMSISVGSGASSGASPWSFATVQPNDTSAAAYFGPGITYAAAGSNTSAVQYYFEGNLSYWNGLEWGAWGLSKEAPGFYEEEFVIEGMF